MADAVEEGIVFVPQNGQKSPPSTRGFEHAMQVMFCVCILKSQWAETTTLTFCCQIGYSSGLVTRSAEMTASALKEMPEGKK
jgi:hypothetical protein